MLTKIFTYAQNHSINCAVVLYFILAVSEQLANGIIGTHFVIKDLTDVYIWIFAQLTAKHTIDSTVNSKIGEPLR